MVRERDIKKSQFIEVLATETGDYFDIVRNGQNFKVSRATLITDFGASGPLEALGEITGTPILSVIADTNYIRNIISGAGVIASISAQNGVRLDHNFTVDKTGVPLMINESATSPTFRSIQAGTGITVGGAGDIIQIATSGTPGSTKTVQVFEEGDFPAPVAGVITLADDTEYFIQNDITTANRFVIGNNTVIKGSDAVTITLTYTGSTTLFTAVDKEFKLADLRIIAATGTLFDISSSGTNLFRCYNSTLYAYNIGNFDSMLITYFLSCLITCLNTGITFSGTHVVALISACSLTNSSATSNTIDIGVATFNSFYLDRLLFNSNSTGYLLEGAASSANIVSSGLGSIFNCQQLGTGPFLSSNITSYDDRWEMILNPAIINSLDLALTTHSGGTITITTAATPVIIGATWTSVDMHRFTHTVGGRWTYNGKGSHVAIDASISATVAVSSYACTFYVYINGVQITASGITRTLSGSVGNISLIWETALATNDYIEIWCQNDTSNVDIVINAIKLRIRS